MLEHGGRLRAAAHAYGIPASDWLDLSTGINPHPWPGASQLRIPSDAWARLPEADDGLAAAAQACYAASHALPVAGSQAAIQTLPWLRAPCRVAVATPGYGEHAQAWRRAGHTLLAWDAAQAPAPPLDRIDVLVLMQPNNPTGMRVEPTRLLDWHGQLAARGGWLVVDEAFVDATPADSLAAHAARPGLVVLRSLGKFFGLAGARVGFVLAAPGLLHQLEERLGPWPVAGPSRWVAQRALQDQAWQAATRLRLIESSQRLADLLATHDLAPSGGCALFQWVVTPQAAKLQQRLAQRGILVRQWDAPASLPSLRFGLPGAEAQWARLADALGEISQHTASAPLSHKWRPKGIPVGERGWGEGGSIHAPIPTASPSPPAPLPREGEGSPHGATRCIP